MRGRLHLPCVLALLILLSTANCRFGYDALPIDDAGADADAESTVDADNDANSALDADSDTDGDTPECLPTESTPETTCDGIDNDCNGRVDDVDVGGDGFCDCLGICIIGERGNRPDANIEDRISDRGVDVARVFLDRPSVVTDALLAGYNVLIIDQMERPLSEDESAAVERFVLDSGGGLITLIGYANGSESADRERHRTSSVLSPFGLEYRGGYLYSSGIIPDFDTTHPVSAGIVNVNFNGGIAPHDAEGRGLTEVFATVSGDNAGLAHQTAGAGRIIMWGDEWITFDSDWTGFDDTERFWAQMLDWVTPDDQCEVVSD